MFRTYYSENLKTLEPAGLTGVRKSLLYLGLITYGAPPINTTIGYRVLIKFEILNYYSKLFASQIMK